MQEVHDDEHQEKKKQTAQQTQGSQETKLREDKNSEKRTISKTPTTRPLQKTTMA